MSVKQGRPFYYPLTADQLEQKINSYFDGLREDPTRRGGPSDFLAYIGMDNKQAIEITKKPPGGYEKHSKLMVRAATLMRAHLETSPAWANGNSSKAIFLSKTPTTRSRSALVVEVRARNGLKRKHLTDDLAITTHERTQMFILLRSQTVWRGYLQEILQ